MIGNISLIVLAGCAGGGLNSSTVDVGSESPYASDALVQLIEYETFRNLMIENMLLPANGPAIAFLDNNATLFGGADENGNRNASASATRMNAVYQFSDRACREAVSLNKDVLFPDELDPTELYRRVRGQPPTDLDVELVNEIMGLNGFSSLTQRKHAICVACLAGIRTHLK